MKWKQSQKHRGTIWIFRKTDCRNKILIIDSQHSVEIYFYPVLLLLSSVPTCSEITLQSLFFFLRWIWRFCLTVNTHMSVLLEHCWVHSRLNRILTFCLISQQHFMHPFFWLKEKISPKLWYNIVSMRKK